MLERIDAQAVLAPSAEHRPGRLAVNLRVGQRLTLKTADGCAIEVVLEGKHGYGARLVVVAHKSVQIMPPET